MSIKRGLVGFGMSATLAAGGFYSLHEWDAHAHNKLTTENKAIAEQQHHEEDVYGWIGGVALIGAGIGSVLSFLEAITEDDTLEVVNTDKDS